MPSPGSRLALTPRWPTLRPHVTQHKLWTSRARFNVVEASRRSGKTTLAKMDGSLETVGGTLPDFRVVFGAPTRDQAKAIFWEDLKALIPSQLFAADPRESDLEIQLIYGPLVKVVGLDEPRRIEGPPIDRLYCDEMAEMKEGTFDRNIRPALATPGRLGRGWFFGVPRIGHVPGGGKEFKKIADIAKSGKDPDFAYFTWNAYGIVDEREIEAAKATMDPMIFAQEFLAQRVSLGGRAYYTFEREVHAREELPYKPRNPLIFMFDFNVEPGPAVVGQEHRFRERPHERQDRPEVADEITAIIGQVHIPKDSNTPSVCRRLIADWGKHEGDVLCYGDPSGGARTTKIDGQGTDWTVIRDHLYPVFGDRLSIRGPGTERSERLRLNALRSRLRTADGKVHLLIDPVRAPKVADDFEETTLKPGSAGEVHKPSGTPYSHWTEAVGFYCVRAHPIGEAQHSSSTFAEALGIG